MDVLNTHLPRIVDLASNFNIDLKEVLSEYCRKLRENVPEFMDSFSFPQAALLLQHCAEIYGRKVDYVYNLAVELCELMNVRLYTSGTEGANDAEQASSITLPKRAASMRRRKTTATLMTEDFQFIEFSLGKPKVLEKKLRRRRHVRESGTGRFVVINKSTHPEHPIYEDEELASIGPKNQFRINWPMQDNCSMEENIMDRGSGSSWAVFDVGVSNMPTPEYSDDGNMESLHVDDESLHFQTACVPVPEITVELSVVTQPLLDEGISGALSPPSIEVELPEKTVSEGTFQLPYELTKKGIREAGPESNRTLFLFSNMLKRSLQMNGVLPITLNTRSSHKKWVSEHVQYIKKRYNLDKRRSGILCFTEQQPDFLGFEEEFLPEVPEVLSAVFDVGPPEDVNEEAGVTSQCSVNDVTTDDTGEDQWENDSEEIMKQYQNKRTTTFDEAGVADWRSDIQRKLSSAEKLRPFDVHKYGTDIIDSFSNVGETISFDEMVGGIGAGECARYFVSTLMLANTSNLLLESKEPNSLKLTLNSRERHHEMEDILVPPSAGGKSNQPQQSEEQLLNHVRSAPSKGVRSVSMRKRFHDDDQLNSTTNDGFDGLERRHQKQIPGTGPWVNKSHKRSRAE